MNLPEQLTIVKILAAPRQSIIYLASTQSSNTHTSSPSNIPNLCVAKTPRETSPAILEAYQDEYETLKNLSHPILPNYYAFIPELIIGPDTNPVPALLMEHIDGTPISSMKHLTTKQLKKYILDLGDALLLLLSKGVLYTDLHPGNLLISNGELKLIDFTCAYYFLRNPYPSYTPKISYHLNQNLKGQQLLVQALTFLLTHLPDTCPTTGIPTSLIQLGENPHSGLTLSDFLTLLSNQWKTS